MNRALHLPILRRALVLFLPISAAISVVLVPMALLYERSRRETLQTRVQALMEASAVRARQTFREVKSNSGVVLTVPAMTDLWSGPGPDRQALADLGKVFRSQLREYERYSSLRIYDRNGAPLLAVDQPSAAAADGANQALMPEVLAQADRLAPRQLWFRRCSGPRRPPVLACRPRTPTSWRCAPCSTAPACAAASWSS